MGSALARDVRLRPVVRLESVVQDHEFGLGKRVAVVRVLQGPGWGAATG